MARDPLLYSSNEHNIEVYLSDIDTLLKIGSKKRLLFANIKKTKKIDDIKEGVILFEKSVYDPERSMLTMRAVLNSNIKLSESSWTVSVDSRSFCKDIITALINEEPTEEFLASRYGKEFIDRIVNKIKKTASKDDFIVIEENIIGLGFIKYDDNCINTFESCNFALNLIETHDYSRDMENNKGKTVKIEINVGNYILSINHCVHCASKLRYMCFLINATSDCEIIKNNLNYVSFEDFKSEDEWKKDRSRYLSIYGSSNNMKISNKMFSF